MSSLCCLVVAEDAQVRGEISGVGVIVAESAATPGQGVLIHTAGFVVALAAIVRAGRTAGHWSVESRFAPRSCDWVTPAASRRTSRSSVRSKGELGCSRMEAAGRPACTSPSVLLLRGWLGGVARDGQVEQDHGVVVGSAGLG